jgi:8-oxo-dGTP pyrophosphatase MutT (NUDIX family)
MRRPAAVTIAILRPSPNGVIFLERAAHLRDHPGQIGLPGGGVDAADGDDLERTARRELEEEVGINPLRATYVGRLPLVRQRINTFDVPPFVAIVDDGPLTIDASETASLFTVPLETILGPSLRDGKVNFKGLRISSPILDYEGRQIWGLTARILQTFAAAWNEGPLRLKIERALS